MKYTIIFFSLLLTFFACGTKESDKVAEKAEPAFFEEEAPKISWFGTPDKVSADVEVSQKNFYVIFDGSGSMKGKKLTVAKKALKKFIRAIPGKSNIGLYAFDKSGVSERAVLGSEKNLIVEKVDQIVAGGATPLGKSVNDVFEKIKKQARTQLGYGDYNLVIITDGKATDSGTLTGAVDKILKTSPVIIHTIGFRIGTDHVLNQPGRILYKTASNYKELSQGLEKVLAETEDFTVLDFDKTEFKIKER